MKKSILLLTLFAAFPWLLTINAVVQEDDEVKVYGHNEFGIFSGTYSRSEIDSIVLSHYDADSVYHKDFVAQTFYVTSGSGYSYKSQYPLDVIKSVCLKPYVELTDFTVDKCEHKYNGFTINGNTYSYKFDCSFTVTLNIDEDEVEDWGYKDDSFYGDDYYSDKGLHSLKSYETPYTVKYTYYSDRPTYNKWKLCSYVKLKGEDERLLECEKEYSLEMDLEDLLSCPDENHPHIIDLGLPSGTKWSCCDVGSSTPEEWGSKYAWAETEEKEEYTEENYSITENTVENCMPIDSLVRINEYGLGLCILNISGTNFDVAHVKWGDGWRMPTEGEIQELLDECTWEKCGNGCLVVGPNGNTIYIKQCLYTVEIVNPITGGTVYEARSYAYRSANGNVSCYIADDGTAKYMHTTPYSNGLVVNGNNIMLGKTLVEDGMLVRPVK